MHNNQFQKRKSSVADKHSKTNRPSLLKGANGKMNSFRNSRLNGLGTGIMIERIDQQNQALVPSIINQNKQNPKQQSHTTPASLMSKTQNFTANDMAEIQQQVNSFMKKEEK